MIDLHIIIRQDDDFIDVSDKKLILWSAGGYAQYVSTELQLTDIALVIDSNPDLTGKKVVLFGTEYIISCPDVLKTVEPSDYYIFIGSINYREEIMHQIASNYGNVFFLCSKTDDFFRSYVDLEAMLLFDPMMIKKVCTGNISLILPQYIKKIKNILAIYLEDYKVGWQFIPIKEGFRISFIILDDKLKGRYVVHFPAHKFREEYTPSDKKYIIEAYKCKILLKPDRLIKVYEDDEGIEIEKYAGENISWNEATIKNAMKALRKVHNSEIEINIDRNPWDRLVHREIFLAKTKSYIPEKLRERIHGTIKDEVCKYEPRMCHGDFHKGNIVLYGDQIVIIDWEWIGKSDPFLDICHFMNNLGSTLEDLGYTLEKGMTLYLQRKPSEMEMRHAQAVSIMDIYMGYCMWLIQMHKPDERTEQKIAGLLDEYEKRYKLSD